MLKKPLFLANISELNPGSCSHWLPVPRQPLWSAERSLWHPVWRKEWMSKERIKISRIL